MYDIIYIYPLQNMIPSKQCNNHVEMIFRFCLFHKINTKTEQKTCFVIILEVNTTKLTQLKTVNKIANSPGVIIISKSKF